MHIPNAWVYGAQIVDRAGRAPTTQFLNGAFPNVATGPPGGGPHAVPTDFQAGLAKLAATYHALVTYQPASRYWAFQGLETAVFIALALVLAGLSFWWVRRRLA